MGFKSKNKIAICLYLRCVVNAARNFAAGPVLFFNMILIRFIFRREDSLKFQMFVCLFVRDVSGEIFLALI